MKRTAGVVLGWIFLVVASGAAMGQVPAVPGQAGSWLGDHGHYLRMKHRLAMLNLAGEGFALTIHRDVLYGAGGVVTVRVAGPAGEGLVEQSIPPGQGPFELTVPAAGAGVYTALLDTKGVYVFVRCELPQMVTYAGAATATADGASFALLNMLPRRWWFFVPAGVSEFQVVADHTLGHASGREDMAIDIYTPRGQRLRSHVGDKPAGDRQGRRVELSVPVEPSMAGRFWSLVVSNGDSHWHSDNSLALQGVPPYLAPSPEQWFDPDTGQGAPVELVTPEVGAQMPGPKGGLRFAHSMPQTWLGDQSYAGFLGAHRVSWRNADGQAATVGVGTYVLTSQAWRGELAVDNPGGTRLLDDGWLEEDWQRNERRHELPAGTAGTYTAAVDANHWFMWTDPGMPMVLRGGLAKPSELRLEVTGPRDWYFHVPAGREQFVLSARTLRPGDLLVCEVHAADRLVRVFDAAAEAVNKVTVVVPPELAGRLWFLRLYAASGTRYAGTTPNQAQRPAVQAALDFDGVPAVLASTWGQWFDPE